MKYGVMVFVLGMLAFMVLKMIYDGGLAQ